MRRVLYVLAKLSIVVVLVSCSDPLRPDAAFPGIPSNEAGILQHADKQSITLAHNYPIFRTQQQYLRAFREEQQRLAARQGVTTQSQDCGVAESAMPLSDSRTAYYSDGANRLGAVHTFATGGSGVPWWLSNLFFRQPGRFSGYCDGIWRYGQVNSSFQEAAVDNGYGVEENDSPPDYPPDGVDYYEYFNLNPAERALLWQMAMDFPQEVFLAMVWTMREIKTEAEVWAAAQTSVGATDGPQDAYRHAYWQCRLTKAFGVQFAREWGDAHEKYQRPSQAAAVRMDLRNNAVGRKVGEHHPSCAEGIQENSSELQMALFPPPTSVVPLEPVPPQPPLEQ
jgi:hypothetical protein